MPLQYVKSNQGNDHLIHNGHRYSFQKYGADINIWVCVKKRWEKCSAIIHTANNEIVEIIDEHNYTPDTAKIEVKMIKAKIKNAAETTSDHPQVIIASCTEGISASAAVQLPALRSMKRTIGKQRVKVKNSHPLPKSLPTLHIPELYQRTSTNENFLLFDSGPSSERILIFGTQKNIQHMENSSEWNYFIIDLLWSIWKALLIT